MLRRLISIAGLVLAYGAFASPVHANFFDRLKDIYETPERLQQLQDQYSHAVSQLEHRLKEQQELLESQAELLEAQAERIASQAARIADQAEQIESQAAQLAIQAEELEASRRRAEALTAQQEELRRENEAYRRQYEALLAENRELSERLRQAEQYREDPFGTALGTVAAAAGSALGLLLLYAAAVRLWRYAVWRRQAKTFGSGIVHNAAPGADPGAGSGIVRGEPGGGVSLS